MASALAKMLKNPDWRKDTAFAFRVQRAVGKIKFHGAIAGPPKMERAPSKEDLDARKIDFSPLKMGIIAGRLGELTGKGWIRLLYTAWPDAQMTAYEIGYTVAALQAEAGLPVTQIRSLSTSVYNMDKFDELVRVGEKSSRHGGRITHHERVYGRGDNFQEIFATRRTPRRGRVRN